MRQRERDRETEQKEGGWGGQTGDSVAQSHGHPRAAGRDRDQSSSLSVQLKTQSSCEDAVPLLSDTGWWRLAVGAGERYSESRCTDVTVGSLKSAVLSSIILISPQLSSRLINYYYHNYSCYSFHLMMKQQQPEVTTAETLSKDL